MSRERMSAIFDRSPKEALEEAFKRYRERSPWGQINFLHGNGLLVLMELGMEAIERSCEVSLIVEHMKSNCATTMLAFTGQIHCSIHADRNTFLRKNLMGNPPQMLAKKVYIEIDSDMFVFFPVDEEHYLREYYSKPMTMEISKELYDEYYSKYRDFREVQRQVEQLFRIQESKTPSTDTPIPDYKLLNKD